MFFKKEEMMSPSGRTSRGLRPRNTLLRVRGDLGEVIWVKEDLGNGLSIMSFRTFLYIFKIDPISIQI